MDEQWGKPAMLKLVSLKTPITLQNHQGEGSDIPGIKKVTSLQIKQKLENIGNNFMPINLTFHVK